MRFTFKKEERLKSKKGIEALFAKGKYLRAFPVRVVYLKQENRVSDSFKVGFSVSKRQFKTAVDRNRVKRLMREAYRLNKHNITSEEKNKCIAMFIFSDSKIPSYAVVEKAMISLIEQLSQKIEA